MTSSPHFTLTGDLRTETETDMRGYFLPQFSAPAFFPYRCLNLVLFLIN
jgi:hypothetical protein